MYESVFLLRRILVWIIALILIVVSTSTFSADRTTVAEVQKALSDQGFDPGPVDGKIGIRTRSALGAFQEKSGLPKTSKIDAKTLAKLGITGSRSRSDTGVQLELNSSQELDDGRKLKSSLFGKLILGSDGLISNAKARFEGQFAQVNDSGPGIIIANSYAVKNIKENEIVLSAHSGDISFFISKDTQICDDDGSIDINDINAGEMVTVITNYVNRKENVNAAYIKRGAMLLGGLPPFNPNLFLSDPSC